MMLRLSVLLVCLLAAVPVFAQGQVLRNDGLQVTLHSQVQPVPLNLMHSWVITLHSAEGRALESAIIQVDGGMPAHDHGLATRPQVTTALGDGRYLLEGVRFHMAGEWLLHLQVEHQGRHYQIDVALHL